MLESFPLMSTARANPARARSLQLDAACLKLDAARSPPSPSVSSEKAGPVEFTDEDDWRKSTRETISDSNFQYTGANHSLMAFLVF